MKLIKLHPDSKQSKEIEGLMEQLHQNTAAKAVMLAAVNYTDMTKDRNRYKEHAQLYKDQLYDLARAIDNVHEAEQDMHLAKDALVSKLKESRDIL